ncbi:MAG: hypothetical protein JO307_15425, partial [Bryobacterales bacterium]|nr:hypothetical protein [Bryobacterales bacterium]
MFRKYYVHAENAPPDRFRLGYDSGVKSLSLFVLMTPALLAQTATTETPAFTLPYSPSLDVS